MKFREYYIYECMRAIEARPIDGPLNVIEIGCMFKEDEGLSTLRISKVLRASDRPTRFVSIDMDSDHIDAARALLRNRDSGLSEVVEFVCSNSLEVLPRIVEEMGVVHFALIDGSGQPEICLREFELIASHLGDSGAILVDDLGIMRPTELYTGKRLFGKGSLIYPLLIAADYLRFLERDAGGRDSLRDVYRSAACESLDHECLAKLLGDREFRVLGSAGGGQAMLLFGDPALVDRVGSGSTGGTREAAVAKPSQSLLGKLVGRLGVG